MSEEEAREFLHVPRVWYGNLGKDDSGRKIVTHSCSITANILLKVLCKVPHEWYFLQVRAVYVGCPREGQRAD